MGTTQTAIARLEAGKQSPTMNTLQSFARANGFCLEIGFVRSDEEKPRTGCVLVVDYHAACACESETLDCSAHPAGGLKVSPEKTAIPARCVTRAPSSE